MESLNTNIGKKNFLAKTWNSCRSIPRSHSRGGFGGLTKSKSLKGDEKNIKKVTPVGFFPVCVGPEKQRFAVKTKYANHPLFTMLLEDAETEYGYNCNGPILLPCDVDLFYKVISEMEAKDVEPLGYGSCSPFNSRRRLGTKGVDQMGKGYGSYEALPPWSLIKMN